MESVIFRLYFQRHCHCHWFDNVFGIKTKYHRLRRFLGFFFLENQEYKMSTFGICFILYFLKLSACRAFVHIVLKGSLKYTNNLTNCFTTSSTSSLKPMNPSSSFYAQKDQIPLKLWHYTVPHRQTNTSCKSVAGLSPRQADIRMHSLLWLDDNKSAASCQQA